jgi:N-acetylneuraminic acid mutarotase
LLAESQEVAFAVGGRAGPHNAYKELATVERYDAASGAWRITAPMATAREAFGMCELAGELYVTGGIVAGVLLASVERYNPSLDTWSAAPAMPYPRHGHCACAVGDALYVLGGVEEIKDDDDRTISSVLKFDSQTQTWNEVAPMPAERDAAGACVVGSSIYVFGGRDNVEEATSTTYRYSTETTTWAILAPMPETKCLHSVCVLDGLIYAMGGEDSDEDIVNSVYRFDPGANLWSEVARTVIARTGFATFVLGGSIHAVGGSDGQSRHGSDGVDALTSMERYCVASDSWSEVSDLNTARDAFGAIVVGLEVDFFDSLIAKAKRRK